MPSLRLVALLAIPAQVALAQQSPSAHASTTLSLEEAIGIARRNNPAYLQTSNGLRTSDATLRSAYGALLPSSSASFRSAYQQSGQQFVQGAAIPVNGDQLQSGYSLGVNYAISAGALAGLKAAKATHAATEAEIAGASEVLRAQVTQQYITVLQSEARAALQDTLVQTAQGQLDLAKARMAVGSGTALDIRRAEVALGQVQVQSLTAHNAASIERLRLYQLLGSPQTGAVELTTKFVITKPTFSLDSLLELGKRINPDLNAYRSRDRAAGMNVQAAKSLYTPTLSISTGWGGVSNSYANGDFAVEQQRALATGTWASCVRTDSIRTRIGMQSLGCGVAPMFTDEMAAAARSANNKFPFKFSRSPMSVSAGLSFTVFDNFRREQQVEQAQVSRDNTQYAMRARELQLNTEVTQAYLNLMTQVRTVELQEQNAAKAREELSFAEERYRVGAVTFLEVTTSRGTFEQAQIDRLNSIYEFHKAFAVLESAVGRPLR